MNAAETNWELWKHLRQRYETPTPRRLLSLDGGGIRGMISVEILEKLEREIKRANGLDDSFRLCHFFDYIAGTSTGAIIAALLSIGKSVTEIKNFYSDRGKEMFDSATLFKKWKFLYNSQPLQEELRTVFGANTTLEPEHLQTLLLVVLKNYTTDSPWPVSSNPFARYNAPERKDCNLKIPLWQIVRASTAAPVFFPPEVINWGDNHSFVFVDGGVTPYNNPAFQLYKMATLPEYKLNWKTGEKNLLLVSIGTGIAPGASEFETTNFTPDLIKNMKTLPPALMYAIQVEQDVNCRAFGRCSYGASVDKEIGDMMARDTGGKLIPLSIDTGKQFTYVRYNADLSDTALNKLGFSSDEAARARAMDCVDFMPGLKKIGEDAAKSVSIDHLGEFARLAVLDTV